MARKEGDVMDPRSIEEAEFYGALLGRWFREAEIGYDAAEQSKAFWRETSRRTYRSIRVLVP